MVVKGYTIRSSSRPKEDHWVVLIWDIKGQYECGYRAEHREAAARELYVRSDIVHAELLLEASILEMLDHANGSGGPLENAEKLFDEAVEAAKQATGEPLNIEINIVGLEGRFKDFYSLLAT